MKIGSNQIHEGPKLVATNPDYFFIINLIKENTIVMSDNYLLMIHKIEPCLRDSTPDPLQAASLHFFGLKSKGDLTLEKPPKPAYEVQSMVEPCPLRDSLRLVNRSADPSNTPGITWASANRVLHEFPQEQDPANDEKYYVSKKNMRFPIPAQPMMDHQFWIPPKISNP
ncbi:hypothetical protein DSO57_1037890 [Entomophthora muscae]|uniref:Uncharacterized protein n=1 Tax=Entomophthora muscae TaxID=34485 RepID=A0ACC2U883_9FUNG|nr:hypothetical protein DSO57_1037890 [Entomophthora muscae]